jgi:hypothetical protein
LLAHCLGLTGELLNFIGALIIAMDLFGRGSEEERRKSYEMASKSHRELDSNAVSREGHYEVAATGFVNDYLSYMQRRLAWWGTGFMLSGFLLLAGYHVLEMLSP